MRDSIRFLLGAEPTELRCFDPTLTVLDWLRTQARRPGCKEGCNEGDCGACTIVVARPEAGRLRYRSVNACIQFLGALDGCQLLTVEDLQAPGGALHPVQQAMVEQHGSQCGFCTPGFIMSLFAMAKCEPEAPSDEKLDDILAGNLCRCTGYAPIARAARQIYDSERGDRFDEHEAETVARLSALHDEETIRIEHQGRLFIAPACADELAAVLVQHPAATILAGSTDVGLWVTKQMKRLDTIVWTGRVRELRDIRDSADGLEIGAAVTYAEAVERLAALYPDFGELVRRLGSAQIQNVGTIGGNIANGSPIGDSSPALMATGAVVHLRRGHERRTTLLEDFFLGYGRQDRGPGEFIERIFVPRPAPGSRYRAYKVSKRFDQDISAVMGAFLLRLEGERIAEIKIAFGGMAAIPQRARLTENILRGQIWNEASVQNAQQALEADFQPISDLRASGRYRMRVAKNLLMRLYLETTSTVETRLVGDRTLAHA